MSFGKTLFIITVTLQNARTECNNTIYLKYVHNPHGVAHITIRMILIECKGHIDDSPCNYSRPTVEKQFEVKPFADARIEFNSHHEVVDKVSRKLAIVRARWEIVSFDVDKDRHDVSQDVGYPQHLTPVVQECGWKPVEV